jgi:hypothetical protein
MKAVFSVTTAVVAAMIVSCTPYDETPPPTPGPDVAQNDPKTLPPDEQADPSLNRTTANKPKTTAPKIPTRTEDPSPTKPDPKPSMQVARPVPGKPGFVFSPFNNKLIDVKGIPSGTLVQDPTYSPEEKKYFRVP